MQRGREFVLGSNGSKMVTPYPKIFAQLLNLSLVKPWILPLSMKVKRW
jgi:hypothetical protein